MRHPRIKRPKGNDAVEIIELIKDEVGDDTPAPTAAVTATGTVYGDTQPGSGGGSIDHLELSGIDDGTRGIGSHVNAVKRYENAGDPDANDDSAGTGGNGVFFTGDTWVNTTDDASFTCMDDTATAAVWTGTTDNALTIDQSCADNSTTDITLAAVADVSAVHITYHCLRGSDYEFGTLTVGLIGAATAQVIRVSSSDNCGLTIAADVDSGNLRINVTTDNSGDAADFRGTYLTVAT